MDVKAGGEAACLLYGSSLILITVLLFHLAVFFLTQRRVQSSESLKLGVTKGLTQALRKAFHQNDVSAHVSALLSELAGSAHPTLESRVGLHVVLLPRCHTHTCRKWNLSSFWQITNILQLKKKIISR